MSNELQQILGSTSLEELVSALISNLHVEGVPSALKEIAYRTADEHPEVLDRIVDALISFGLQRGYIPMMLVSGRTSTNVTIRREELPKLGIDVYALLLRNDLLDKDSLKDVRGLKLKMLRAREADPETFLGHYVVG